MLNMFTKALKAEYIKTKASGLKWLCLGAAVFIPLIQFLFLALVSDTVYVNKPINPWMDFLNGSIKAFAPFFYPLLAVLIIIRLAQFEHKADAWKLMETQPVTKAALYFSKWAMCLLVAAACLLLLLLLSTGFVFLLSLVKGDAEYRSSSIEWGEVLGLTGRIWIAGLGMMAFQYLLSVSIPNFVAPFVIGLIGTIAGTIFSGFEILPWWMYSAPGNTAHYFSMSDDWMLPHEKLSIIFMLLFLFIGYRLFTYKKIKYAVIKPATRMIPVLASFALFAVAFWFFNKSKQQLRGTNTVLAGKINTEEKIDKVYLFDAATRDTVEVIKVQDNRFSARLSKDIDPTFYYLKIGSQMAPVYLGRGDSLHIEAEISETKSKKTITGTRLAENLYSASGNLDENLWYLEQMASRYKPEAYAKNVLSEWKAAEKKIDGFKTVNNVKPSDDFLEMQKKLLRLKMLQLLDHHYPQVFRVHYPNDTLKYPKEVEALRKQAPLNDPSLLHSDDYIQFLGTHYRNASHAFNDSMMYSYVVENFPPGKAKDIFLFRSLSELISRVSDSIRRENFITKFGVNISSQRLLVSLKEKNRRLNSMKRGRPAPEIHAETLAGQPFLVSSLKNRFIVLDIWATWCGPCKKEAPYFKELAERLTSENVAFVSLSIDEKKSDWKLETFGKGSKILQLWATNAAEEMTRNYNVEFIPRFILIDDKGRIVNAQMPKPSDPEFENIIRKEARILYSY